MEEKTLIRFLLVLGVLLFIVTAYFNWQFTAELNKFLGVLTHR